MKKALETHYKKIVLLIMSAFLIVSLLNAYNDSATFDEVAHIPAGYSYLTEHDTRLNPEHPPLIKNLSALPLVFMDLKFDTSKNFWTGNLTKKWDDGQWAAGRHLLYEAGNDWNMIIFWSRVPIVLLSVLLGLFLFRWGKEIAGVLGGLGILLLYAFDPNILGHNHFVTTDLGVAAFLTFSFYYFLKFIKSPSWKNTLLAGLFLGLLLVTKFSSVVAVPIYGLVLLTYPLIRKVRDKSGIEIRGFAKRLAVFGEYIGKSLVAFTFSIFVVWTVYAYNTYEMPKEIFAETVDYLYPASDTNIKSVYTKKVLLALNENNLTRPLATYVYGPSWMFKRVSGGNSAYFMGQVGNGFESYFQIVFVIKETIPFLLLIIFATVFTVTTFFRRFSETKLDWTLNKIRLLRFLRGSVVDYALLGFIVLYAFLSISGGLNIGFRHLFPIIPFAYILVVKKVYEFMRTSKDPIKHAVAVSLVFLSFWQVATTAMAYPSFTSYFNEIIGGSSKGYKYVTDSNTDWGRDLKRLGIYLDSHPEIDKIRIDYFGGGDIYKTIGQERSILWWDSRRPIENGWYAISANFLQGSIYGKEKNESNSYQWTRKYEPVDQIGASILIYHVDDVK